MDYILILFSILIFFQVLVPLLTKRLLEIRRLALIRTIENKRKSRVITMIHRQETLSLLGIPVSRFLDIEDSEQILSAIHMTPEKMPIDLIIHTPGGLVLASEQIAYALKRHKGKITVFVPHYAMSGGTMIALAADEIFMNHNAVLGSIDPLLGSPQTGFYPAISILKALKIQNKNRDDLTLIQGDIAKKALDQVHKAVYGLLLKNHKPKEAVKIANILTSGHWTHDSPIIFEQVKELGLALNDKIPGEIYSLMKLYPQPAWVKRAVEFIPTPYTIPAKKPPKKE